MCKKIKTKRIERLTTEHIMVAQSFSVNPDHCENPWHFESYLKFNAMGDFVTGMATTHVLVEYTKESGLVVDRRICGYVSVKTTSLIYKVDHNLVGSPAVEIAELAIDKNCERDGNGRALLEFVIRLCEELREQIGIKYLLVCAEKNAIDFYKHVLPFGDAGKNYIIPREIWNDDCVPLYLRLPERL